MAPTSPNAQIVLQKRIVIIPHDGQKPTFWLSLIVLGGITAFSMLSALVGCLAAKCCRKKRNQQIIEKKVAEDIKHARQRRNTPSSTVVDDEDDMVERRTAYLVAIDVFAGREQKLYANHKTAKLNRSWKTSSVKMPVTMTEMKKMAVRSMSSCDGCRPEPQQAIPSEVAAVPTSRPSEDLATAEQAPVPLHHARDTSIDSQEPATLMENICSSDSRRLKGKERRAQTATGG